MRLQTRTQFKLPHSSRSAWSGALACLLFLLTAQPGTAQPIAPTPYEARYEARAMGMRTSAWRTLALSNDVYQLDHGLAVSVLGANLITVNERTEFNWKEQQAVPLQYHYKQSGVRRRDERVTFNWPQQSATMNRDGNEQTQTLEAGFQDNLSFSAQMSADLLNKPEMRAPDTILSYQILDARRLEIQDYKVIGEERISTPAGELDTIKLERIRDSDSGRSTVIWLSVQHQYILAKLLQVESSGSEMALTLESVTWP